MSECNCWSHKEVFHAFVSSDLHQLPTKHMQKTQQIFHHFYMMPNYVKC